MFFNVSFCLLILATNQQDDNRKRYGDIPCFFREYCVSSVVERWSNPVSGILLVVWMFFAIGPGSIFGNFVFGDINRLVLQGSGRFVEVSDCEELVGATCRG